MKLVRRKGGQIDAGLLDVRANLADGLCRIAVQQQPAARVVRPMVFKLALGFEGLTAALRSCRRATRDQGAGSR